MLFKKKDQVKLDLIDEGDITKLVIDYFNKKDKQAFRTELLKELLKDRGNFLVMVDTNFFSKMEEDHEREWSQNFKEWLEEDGLDHKIMKAKKEKPTGVLGSLFSTQKNKQDFFAYRIGVYMDLKEYDTLIEYHDQVKMGIHIGIGVKSNDIPFLLREYSTGLIDEFNRFEHYDIDLYDYLEVGRMVINSQSFDEIAKIKGMIHTYLGQ